MMDRIQYETVIDYKIKVFLLQNLTFVRRMGSDLQFIFFKS